MNEFDYEDDDDLEALEALLKEYPELKEDHGILPPNTTDEVPEAWVDNGD